MSATALLSLLIAIAVVSSLIMPAISMTLELAAGLSSVGLMRSSENTMVLGASSNMITNAYGDNANDGNSPKELSDVTLLIGDGTDWAAGCNSAAEVIEAAKAKYFLGIASDFCVFLEKDFKPKNSDAEGRVAAGGDVIFTNLNNDWNYQIGNGDYAAGSALTETDNYLEKSNFAHLIANGKVQKINTISQGKNGDDSYLYTVDRYKRFVVSANADLSNSNDYNHRPGSSAYSTSCVHGKITINELAVFYKADLINFKEVFEWLRGQSEKLSRKTATGTASVSNGVLTLTGQGTDSGAATVYFSLDSWDSSINEINYVNVPDNANLVLNCGGSDVTIKSGTRIVKTTINGTEISNTGTISSNNNKKSEQILYNFYEATSVYVDTNFNGTILAPNAEAKSDDECHGHLSGSLIAKSFEGGLEFGYRPYRGTASDILGSTAGYAIPVNKFTENKNEYLPGASFVMKDEDGKTVDSWTSTTGTDYINIPSKVDFEGRTLYDKTNNKCQSTFYTFSERAAPDGYVLNSEKTYTVNITEIVDLKSLIYSDDRSVSIPTKVDSDIQLKYGDQVLGSWKIEILDTYTNTNGVTSQTQRRVTIKDTNDAIIDTFYMDISNSVVTLAGHGTGDRTITEWTETVTSVSSSETDVVTMVETVVSATEAINVTDANGTVVTDENGSTVTETVTVTSVSEVTDQEGNTVTTYVPVTETSYYESSYTSYTDVIVTSETVLSKETQSTVTIPISNLSEAENITVDKTRNYRYVPQSLMIMPLPAAVPDFVNKPGFVFRKVDGTGALLTGADIRLQTKNESGEYTDVTWEWTTSNSKITIDPANLKTGQIYRFHENAPPAGYETAGDIYFTKISATEIKYANSEDELDSGGTSITISSGVSVENRTITMTDIKISGAALTLKKVDSSSNALLSGAKFKLYAAEGETGTPVYPLSGGEPFEVTGGNINLFDMLRNAAAGTYNTSYVENGYLKEGTYYLEEVSSPTGYTQPTEPFYFTIKQSDTGYVIEAGKPQYIAFTVENTSWGQQIWVNGSASNVTKIEVYVDAPASGKLVLYEHETVKDKTASIVNGVATFELDGSKDVGRFKIQNTDYNAGLTVKEVRVYGDSSGSSSSSGTAHTISQIAWGDPSPPSVSKLTFYYADGTTDYDSDISVTTANDYWHSFNLSNFEKKDNVIGIEIVAGGSGTSRLIVQNGSNSNIFGTPISVSAGQTYTLGSTTVSQTPSEPDDPGTSTEESAGTITAEGMTITIGNERAGSTVSLSVEKVWSGDTGYENLRPESITVQLKRSASADKSNPVNILEAVTLNADNKWKYTWPKQDRLQSDGVTPYYYFVEEKSVPSGYTVGYTNNDGLTEGGKITITNTCITKDYDVKKVWVTKGISGVTIPTSITVKLQSSSDNGSTWQDVSGKTLILTAENRWQGKFESLPYSAGIKYRAVETSV
ncbi:MAG: choice-of-anchor A family protein, partial [Oscillospiraceae bacterium]|nr:choice-of-anchor A family protein [Oscillospiraceae bacterium]